MFIHVYNVNNQDFFLKPLPSPSFYIYFYIPPPLWKFSGSAVETYMYMYIQKWQGDIPYFNKWIYVWKIYSFTPQNLEQ